MSPHLFDGQLGTAAAGADEDFPPFGGTRTCDRPAPRRSQASGSVPQSRLRRPYHNGGEGRDNGVPVFPRETSPHSRRRSAGRRTRSRTLRPRSLNRQHRRWRCWTSSRHCSPERAEGAQSLRRNCRRSVLPYTPLAAVLQGVVAGFAAATLRPALERTLGAGPASHPRAPASAGGPSVVRPSCSRPPS